MTINQHWVTKEKNNPGSSKSAAKTCPYFKKISSLASYSLDGQCLAGSGFTGRFCTAKDIKEYCNEDYQQCPLYQVVIAGGVWESQKEDAAAWPSL